MHKVGKAIEVPVWAVTNKDGKVYWIFVNSKDAYTRQGLSPKGSEMQVRAAILTIPEER